MKIEDALVTGITLVLIAAVYVHVKTTYGSLSNYFDVLTGKKKA